MAANELKPCPILRGKNNEDEAQANMKIKAVPISLKTAAGYISTHHRHHQPLQRDKYRVAAVVSGEIVGVVQVNRPVSRILDDGKTLEVVRLCTNGERNVCSFLYSRAARIAKELGYEKIITYILCSESGDSLRASGWHKEADIKGKSWDCPSRKRVDKHPICDKQRWAKYLQEASNA
jgi:hypothetical protein